MEQNRKPEITLHYCDGREFQVPVANIESYAYVGIQHATCVYARGLAWGAEYVREDCEEIEHLVAEAVPAEPPTVTLHHPDTGETRTFRSITRIDGDWMHPHGGANCHVVGECYAQGGEGVCVAAVVGESPTEITIAARDAFGEHWSCKGAEPPVVVLEKVPWGVRDVSIFCEIIELAEWDDGTCKLWGTWLDQGAGISIWTTTRRKDNHNGASRVAMTAAEVRAACAETGVPCPAEGKPAMLYHKSAYCWSGTFEIVDPQVPKLKARIEELECYLQSARNHLLTQGDALQNHINQQEQEIGQSAQSQVQADALRDTLQRTAECRRIAGQDLARQIEQECGPSKHQIWFDALERAVDAQRGGDVSTAGDDSSE